MIEAIDRIASYMSGLTSEVFRRTALVQNDVVRNFEIIGEAARNIEGEAPEVAATHSEILCSVMAAMRNRLAHGYFNVDFASVWVTACDELPPLRSQIEGLHNELLRQDLL